MLWEFFLAGFIVAALLLALGWITLNSGKQFGNYLLVGGGIVLILLGLFVAMDEGLEIQSSCLNHTSELSHVWNCSNTTDNTCLGTPWKESCRAYNETQCRAIDNCTWWTQGGCTGTPGWTCEELYDYGGDEKCRETYGCYIWNETNPHECDNYETTYTYGPCYVDTMDFAYSEALALILMLAGLGTFFLLLTASKFKEPEI